MKTVGLTFLILGLTAFSSAAHAQLVVQGTSVAAQCYRYAVTGNKGSNSAIKTCSEAFETPMRRKDKAATYVNRGILYMRKGQQDLASQDYEAALAINPSLAEAHVNYSASLIRQQKYEAALTSLNKALSDPDSSIRPEALYNRAIILHHKENYRGAYQDLQAALAIRPDWEPALLRLQHYEVRRAG